MKKLAIFDGNSLLNRAFYGIRPLNTRDGLNTNALHGLANMLVRHIEQISPDYAAISFDLPQPTFRHKAYEGYKATRKGMPPELAEQLPYAKELGAALGLAVLALPGWEADDILGTLARTAGSQEVMTYIVSGDRDLLQLINDTTHVLYVRGGDADEYDENRYVSEYGVRPPRLVDVKALMGDTSDNIPGVAGIGEKTAFKLIAAFGSLDGVYENLDDKSITKSVRARLAAGEESARLSYSLARIETEVPFDPPFELSDAAYTGYRRQELSELLTRLEFSALSRRLGLDKLRGGLASTGGAAGAQTEPTRHVTRIPPEELADRINVNTPAAVSITFGSSGGDQSGVITAAACEGGAEPVFYSSEFLSLTQLREFFASGRELWVHDSKRLVTLLTGARVDVNCNFTFDAQLAGYVLDSSGGYSPAELSSKYLGEAYSEEEQQSAGGEAELICRLRPVMLKRLEEEGSASLYSDIELPLSALLLRMERIGFKVDTDALAKWSRALDELSNAHAERVFEQVGYTFNLNSPKQLGEALFETPGRDEPLLPPPKRGKTGYSTSAEVLEKLRPYSPVIENILEYRQAAKLKSTYADGLLRAADSEGRIHTTFTQTVTATGRLSSIEPNLQNIPIRTELGRGLRRCFIPGDESRVLIDADYSQIELRLLAHIAEDEAMIAAFLSGEDIHTSTASRIFGIPADKVTPEHRKRAKAVNFGIVYGIGDFSLAQDIGVSRAAAAGYIKSWLAEYKGVAKYMENIVEAAKRDGYVTTIAGRRRYIPEIKAAKASLRAFGERVAMNSPIQGSAADIIKIAMLRVDEALEKAGLDAKLILQVHDELILESARSCADEAAKILRTAMENAVSLSVPLTVDVTVGDCWGG